MDFAVTRLQPTGTPGRRIPSNPAVFGFVTVLFPELAADQVFVDPAFQAAQERYGIMTQSAQVGDVGTSLICQVVKQSDGSPFDISDASELDIVIGYPDGTKSTKTASMLTDGLDGKLYYVTQTGDLFESGIHSIQAKVIIGADTFWGAVQQFEVDDNIEATAAPGPDPHVGTFAQGDLVGNIFTITHDKGLSAPFPVSVSIFDQDGHEIVPDVIVGFENTVAINLTSFAPISGTWGYVYV